MYELSGLAGIVIIAAVLAYWWFTLKAKEMAYLAAKQYCRREGVQMLDDSLVQKRLALKRGPSGQLHVARRFVFEFTSTGDERYQGWVAVLGATVTDIELEPHRFVNDNSLPS